MGLSELRQSLFWADQLAVKVIERSGREGTVPNIKCQQTPSGGKHIGNLNDVLRAYFVWKAVEEAGTRCEFVHTTDDRDPLKEIPYRIMDLEGNWHESKDFPEIRDYLGKPLCRVPDPFGCCKNWSEHFTKVWMDGIEMLEVHPKLHSVNALYEEGKFEPYIRMVFEKRAQAGGLISEFQAGKGAEYIPFDAICPKCGSLANIDSFDLGKKTVHFTCSGKAIKKRKTEGCSFSGDVPWSEGKLQWRFEWPALWCIFNTTFEPFGKDHWEGSWKSGERICREIYGHEPPIPFVYEFFLVNGQKMSASKGNVYVTQDMLRIMEPEVFLFFYAKRPEKQRDLDLKHAPQLIREFESAERVFFGLEEDRSENREENSKRMYEISMPHLPASPPLRIPYTFTATLTQLYDDETVLKKLAGLGHVPENASAEDMQRARKRIRLARNWVAEFAPEEEKIALLQAGAGAAEYARLSAETKAALGEFAEILASGGSGGQGQDDLQRDQRCKTCEKRSSQEEAEDIRAHERFSHGMKQLCAKHGLKPQEFFAACYRIFVGKERGPRLVPFLNSLEREFVVKRLKGEN